MPRVGLRNSLRAFTLIELSIVLVVIGLIVSGVIAGSKIISAARIRSQIAQIQRYEIALLNFYTQYTELPGDMPTATLYWSTAVNGNGDRFLNDSNGRYCMNDCACGCSAYNNELINFWHHLSLAQVISESYYGTSGTANITYGVGVPILAYNNKYAVAAGAQFRNDDPTGRYNDLGWWLGLFTLMPNRSTAVGVQGNHVNGYGPFMGGDALALDKKIDDGIPLKGRLLGLGCGNPEYDLSSGPSVGYGCSMQYRLR